MLVEFTVKNYLSFKEPATLSMAAASIYELEECNTLLINKLRLLKSAVIYGANASGKSNLIKALRFLRNFVRKSSVNSTINDKIDIEPFLLNDETESQPTFFEIIFIKGGKRYRYNMEITSERVLTENLYFVPSRTEATLFERRGEKIKIGYNFRETKRVIRLTRPNALFLSVAAQFNSKIAAEILEWFKDCHIISGLHDFLYMPFTLELLENESDRKKIVDLISRLDVQIQNVLLHEKIITNDNIPPDFPAELKKELREKNEIKGIDIISSHRRYNSEKSVVGSVDFLFHKNESDGSKKLLALSGLIISALEKSKVLIIDEFDSRLHPLLSIYLIKLFNSKSQQNYNSQLIFTTHDVKLMNSKLFRRDQIWFVAKNEYEETNLYSLIEYKKGIRNDNVFEKNYLDGRFGAIPYLEEIKLCYE